MSTPANSTRPPVSCSSSSRIGRIALHGRHHGAQKSTITGVSAPRTLVELAGRQLAHGRANATSAPAGHVGGGRGTFQIASSTIARLIFDWPFPSVDEADRNLDDAEALAQRAIRRLDLEHVAGGVDRVEVDRLEHVPAEALEASRRVVNRHQEDARVDRGATGDQAPHEAPVLGSATGDVAGAEREVGAGFGRREQAWHVRRVVGEVAVHLQDVVGVSPKRLAEACDVRTPETLFPLPVEDGEPLALRREAVRDLPVPSGELSSITSTRTPSGSSASIIGSRFSRSLYVGRQRTAFGMGAPMIAGSGVGTTAELGRRRPVRPARRPP